MRQFHMRLAVDLFEVNNHVGYLRMAVRHTHALYADKPGWGAHLFILTREPHGHDPVCLLHLVAV